VLGGVTHRSSPPGSARGQEDEDGQVPDRPTLPLSLSLDLR
jgi:hypothetical protein